MNRYPKNRHFNPTASGNGGSGGGSSSGPINAIQISNGVGGFSNRGIFSNSNFRIPVDPDISTYNGQSLTNVNSRLTNYLAVKNVYAGGSISVNIFDDAGNLLPVQSVFKIEATILARQTSGTPGSSAFSFKTTALFRKAQGSTQLTKIGAAILSDSFNDTGDPFVVTGNLNLNPGLNNINLEFQMTTTKVFDYEVWCRLILNSE